MTFDSTEQVTLIGKQSSFDTPVSATKDIGLVQDHALSFEREVIQSSGAGSAEVQAMNTGHISAKERGTVEFQHGRILEYVFGSVAHAETTGDWKHTFTVSGVPPAYTVYDHCNGSADTQLEAYGMMVDNIDIGYEIDKTLTFSYESMGIPRYALENTSSSAVISTLPVFPSALISLSLDGTTASEVQKWSWKIKRDVKQSFGGGSVSVQQQRAPTFEIEFSGTVGFADNSVPQLALGGSSPASGNPDTYEIIMNATNGVSLGSGLRQLYLKVDTSMMTKCEKIMTLKDFTYIEVAGKAILNECYSVDDISSSNW